MKELILGGMRSGKSRIAEQRAYQSGLDVVYIATATAVDEEMRERIALHQQRRPKNWQLVEESQAVGQVIKRCAGPARYLIVDCLTLWLSSFLLRPSNEQWGDTNPFDEPIYRTERRCLLEALAVSQGAISIVSNEINMGVIPMDRMTRFYCDELGLLHQHIAQQCDGVTLVVAGIAHSIKSPTSLGSE